MLALTAVTPVSGGPLHDCLGSLVLLHRSVTSSHTSVSLREHTGHEISSYLKNYSSYLDIIYSVCHISNLHDRNHGNQKILEMLIGLFFGESHGKFNFY